MFQKSTETPVTWEYDLFGGSIRCPWDGSACLEEDREVL